MGLSALALRSHVVYTPAFTGRSQKWVGTGKCLSRIEAGLPEQPESLGSEALITVRAILKKLCICLHYEHSTMPTPKRKGMELGEDNKIHKTAELHF